LGISIGIEKYKTIKNRLRGYYGADILVSKNPYLGMSYDGSTFIQGKFKYSNPDGETLYTEKGGNTYTLGAQGVIGLEYFFAPKMSISSEFGIMFYGSTTGDRTYIPEDGTPEVNFNPGGSAFGITTNTTSLINLFFYF